MCIQCHYPPKTKHLKMKFTAVISSVLSMTIASLASAETLKPLQETGATIQCGDMEALTCRSHNRQIFLSGKSDQCKDELTRFCSKPEVIEEIRNTINSVDPECVGKANLLTDCSESKRNEFLKQNPKCGRELKDRCIKILFSCLQRSLSL